LRITSEGAGPEFAWALIKENRSKKSTYDWTGDVIRYAGDILDYMEIADLLVSHGSEYFINPLEVEACETFVRSKDWFSGYDRYLHRGAASLSEINTLEKEWFAYVNQERPKDFFKTDVLAFISADPEEYATLKDQTAAFLERVEERDGIRTKDIGDMGENMVYGHECMRIKIAGHEELIHLIKPIPNSMALGYDIKSTEEDATHRYIEVKTTISRKELDFLKFHMTTNEWKSAESNDGRYFVYRLLLSKSSRKLFILPDVVGNYRAKNIEMTPKNDGVDIEFSPRKCGSFTPILEWTEKK
jgi:hypothetical protein